MQQYAGIYLKATLAEGCCHDTWHDLYQKMQLQFYVLLMMGAMTPEKCRVILQ